LETQENKYINDIKHLNSNSSFNYCNTSYQNPKNNESLSFIDKLNKSDYGFDGNEKRINSYSHLAENKIMTDYTLLIEQKRLKEKMELKNLLSNLDYKIEGRFDKEEFGKFDQMDHQNQLIADQLAYHIPDYLTKEWVLKKLI